MLVQPIHRAGAVSLKPESVGAGRILHVDSDGTLYLGRSLQVDSSMDDGCSWQPLLSIPGRPDLALTGLSRLASRLVRNEVRALEPLSDDRFVASTRDGVFHALPGDRQMRPSRIESRSTPARSALRFCLGPNERIVWGEYFGNSGRREVRLFASDDGGAHFEIAHVFGPGTIRHVHNLFYDAALEHYWVLAGDHDKEPGIGCLSGDLKHLSWLIRGSQMHRAACAFDFVDSLVYGTDSEMESNFIVRLDKASGRTETIAPLEGSSMYACRFGGIYTLSTTVEPSKINRGRFAVLWASRDGARWRPVYAARKDRWSARYFQYGSLVLPSGSSEREAVAFSGQAVRGIDGLALVSH